MKRILCGAAALLLALLLCGQALAAASAEPVRIFVYEDTLYTYMELEDPPKNLTAYTIRHKNPRPSTEKSLHIFYSYLKELKV